MSAHTPGPWIVLSPENRRGQKQPPRIALEGRAGIIATVGLPSEGDRDANARLIAAAPEMLAALRGAIKVIDALMPGLRYIAVQDYQAVNEVPIALRAALAKAAP